MQHSPEPDGGPQPSRRAVLGFGAVLLAAATGCTAPGGVGSSSSAGSTTPTVPTQTFTFGTPAAHLTLDPALALDNESFRITRQIFEGLVGVDPNTGAPTPALATEWAISEDGLEYSFTLRENVKFHDGAEFDAEAVAANFRRWAELPAELGAGRTFATVFHHGETLPPADGGTGPGVPGGYYAGCRAEGPTKFVLELRRPITGLIEALTTAGFGIASPRALHELTANALDRDEDGNNVSAFGQRPVGTGPFRFVENDAGTVTLRANPDHWGEAGTVGTTVFRPLREPASRLRQLRRRDIDGYDMVTVDGLRDLVQNGQQIVQRDPFSVFFLGMNLDHPVLAQLPVRQAVSHAVDRTQLIDNFFISGTKEARSFVPPSLGVPDAETYYGHNPDAARALLEEAGYDGEPIPFTYPLNITRAYLPVPERIFASLSRQLTGVGLKLKPVPVPWEEGYLDSVYSGDQPGLHLLGWSGAYRDPDHFIGSLFGNGASPFGYAPEQLRRQVVAARSMPNGEERAAAYQAIGEMIAQDVPAVPIAYPISAVALNERVLNYPSSPVMDEVFHRVILAT